MQRLSAINNFCSLPWCCTGLICCALLISGCGSTEESHDDHHDDEHLEHFVPAHKPTSFADLVEQLGLRSLQLKEGSQPGTSDSESHLIAVQEFRDIIGWIPELAADSELRKQDFESAVVTGDKLTAAFDQTLGPQKTQAFETATFEPLIDQLRSLVPKSLDRKDQM